MARLLYNLRITVEAWPGELTDKDRAELHELAHRIVQRVVAQHVPQAMREAGFEGFVGEGEGPPGTPLRNLHDNNRMSDDDFRKAWGGGEA